MSGGTGLLRHIELLPLVISLPANSNREHIEMMVFSLCRLQVDNMPFNWSR